MAVPVALSQLGGSGLVLRAARANFSRGCDIRGMVGTGMLGGEFKGCRRYRM
jgi:hypothetical protein